MLSSRATPVGAGYFCASVGAVDEETIKRSIENQKWEDPGENLKIAAPSEP
jgi:REP element-mobilizing transposase RayT